MALPSGERLPGSGLLRKQAIALGYSKELFDTNIGKQAVIRTKND